MDAKLLDFSFSFLSHNRYCYDFSGEFFGNGNQTPQTPPVPILRDGSAVYCSNRTAAMG
jgi:hypothetical protein